MYLHTYLSIDFHGVGRSHPEASVEEKRGSRPSSMVLDTGDFGSGADERYAQLLRNGLNVHQASALQLLLLAALNMPTGSSLVNRNPYCRPASCWR